jgi:hypothetical protein
VAIQQRRGYQDGLLGHVARSPLDMVGRASAVAALMVADRLRRRAA